MFDELSDQDFESMYQAALLGKLEVNQEDGIKRNISISEFRKIIADNYVLNRDQLAVLNEQREKLIKIISRQEKILDKFNKAS